MGLWKGFILYIKYFHNQIRKHAGTTLWGLFLPITYGGEKILKGINADSLKLWDILASSVIVAINKPRV